MCPQVGYGKPWSLARRWVAAVLPCFWAPSGHGRGLHWIRQLQQSFGSSVLSWSLTQLTFYLMGPTWWTVDLLKRVCQIQICVSCKFWHWPFYLSLSCTDLFISSDIPFCFAFLVVLQMYLRRARPCWWTNLGAAASLAFTSTTSTLAPPWAPSPLSSVWKR